MTISMDALLQSILRGLITYRTGIYILLGLGILLYLRKFMIGLREWQLSVFGLERKIAQRKLISASTGLILLFLMVLGEFILVTIIEPQMPLQPTEISSMINPLADSTATLSSDEVQMALTAEEDRVEQSDLVFECMEDVLEITYPADGDTISGTVEVIGSVNVDNFGSYKYEYSPTGNINWVTIAAGNQLKLDESIGFWYTSALTPGTYLLQLVPLNNVGESLTPCIVTVEVFVEE
jgi:hypothetical protein